MEEKLVGRIEEVRYLKEYENSNKPEFVAVYGRRRVGKTFLIRQTYKNKFSFYVSGVANSNMKEQLHNFNLSLNSHGKTKYGQATNWLDSFMQLRALLEEIKTKEKKIIFIDELPWMDTPKSRFINALEHFWNSWASSRADILLIVCGSATSWIINKLFNSRGGLHNRITKRMYIAPFTLKECEEYFKEQKIVYNRYQIIESYMIVGGVPFYLSLMEKDKSLAQNIDKLCFSSKGYLRDEFNNLYASLFKNHENHIKIVETLAKKRIGMTREEILANSKLSDGGSITKTLAELQECGFIDTYKGYEKRAKLQIFQLVDPYTLFYLNFIKGDKKNGGSFWSSMIDSPKHRAWSGYAFEQVCLAHINQIKQKLGISGIIAPVSSWRSKNTDKSTKGAQIDLLIDRNDNLINICEMKYSKGEFIIDKGYDEDLRNKKNVFIHETNTNKAVHITMVTTYGVKKNQYYGNIQSEVTAHDLFE